MILKSLLMPFLLIVLLSCTASKVISVKSPQVLTKEQESVAVVKSPTNAMPIPTDTIPPASFKIDTLIYISHEPCYGKCPVYDLTIFTDGTILKNSVKYVSQAGQFVGRLTKEQIVELEQQVATSGPWAVVEYYPAKNEFISDFPLTTYLLKWKDRSKTLVVNHTPPATLKILDSLIMNWAERLTWKNITN